MRSDEILEPRAGGQVRQRDPLGGGICRSLAFGVDLFAGGTESHIRSGSFGNLEVQFSGAGVLVKVLILSKLGRIHEEADDRWTPMGGCLANQCLVSCVEGTHRRNQNRRSRIRLFEAVLKFLLK